uniref:Uncharacterized protein n=1 Tax=Caenorhabditis japonica TaxID=281687 RepID=A0A8R1IHE8_CAEJA
MKKGLVKKKKKKKTEKKKKKKKKKHTRKTGPINTSPCTRNGDGRRGAFLRHTLRLIVTRAHSPLRKVQAGGPTKRRQ